MKIAEEKRQIHIAVLLGCLVLIALLGVNGSSQKKSESTLLQRYEQPFCEYGRSSIQGLMMELKADMTANGRIILHPSVSDPVWPYKERAGIINLLAFHRFDGARIEIILGEPEIRTSTELWLLPGEAQRFAEAKPWDMSITIAKPLLVHANTWVDGIGCGFSFDHAFFANALRANTDLGGRIVIRDVSNAAFEAKKKKISKDLTSRNGLSSKHIEFAFLKDKKSDVEYWLVPADHFGPFSGN